MDPAPCSDTRLSGPPVGLRTCHAPAHGEAATLVMQRTRGPPRFQRARDPPGVIRRSGARALARVLYTARSLARRMVVGAGLRGESWHVRLRKDRAPNEGCIRRLTCTRLLRRRAAHDVDLQVNGAGTGNAHALTTGRRASSSALANPDPRCLCVMALLVGAGSSTERKRKMSPVLRRQSHRW